MNDAVARKDTDVTAPDIFKASEERMDRTLRLCSREKADSELHKRLIDDLKKATNEFLTLRKNKAGTGANRARRNGVL
jgi:hypothetical protein